MQMTIKIRLALLGVIAVLIVGMQLLMSVTTQRHVGRTLSAGLEMPYDVPLVNDLRLSGKELALNAIPSPAERRAQRYSGDRLTAFDRQLAHIRENLGALISKEDEAKRSDMLLAPSRTLLALEREITLDLRRAVDAGAPEDEVMLILEEIRLLAGELDGNILALRRDTGEGPAGAPHEIRRLLHESAYVILVNTALGICVLAMLFVLLGRTITRPLAMLAENMTSLADGHTEVEISGQHRHDEIGVMAKALQRIKETLAGSRRSR